MTPTQILTAAKNRYNAIGDNFWSDDELLGLLYDACLDLTRESFLIERTYSTSTVASQQEYAYPTDTIAIKRITYDGKKLIPITLREDDQITGLDQDTTSTGDPTYYFIWNETISLRPIPSTVGTLKIYSYNEPAELLISSTLEIPTQFHMDTVNYIVSEMAAKDKSFNHAKWYLDKWEKTKLRAKAFARKQKRGDAMAHVQDEESNYE
jgi:hypothetical protein